AHREEPVGLDSEEEDPAHDQRGHDRALDEWLGKVHGALPATPALTCTCAPGARRSCPSVTTTSPGARPFSITACFWSELETLTGRDSTVPSCFTTKTNCPCCPRCTASAGATTASRCSPRVSVTTTYCPGQSASS